MKRRPHNRRQLALIAGLLAASVGMLSAQEQEGHPAPFTVSGNASLGFDLYDIRSTPDGSSPSRRPSSLLRLVVNPTISFGDKFSLPFNFIFTVPETTTQLPKPASPGLADFVQNPANSLGLAPRYGWAQFNLGTHTPHLSELSGGDIQLFGVGVDLAPGKFRFAASAGTVGRSVAADTAGRVEGAYARQAYMGKLAYVDSLTEFGLNVVRIRDDGASIPTLMTNRIIQPDPGDLSISDTITVVDPLMPVPEESFTATLNARVPITDGVRVSAEIGGSLFTRNMTADEVPEPISGIKPLMAQRLSTRADIAGTFAFDVTQERWGLSVSSSYIGPGYRTLAYPWMQADRLDVTAAPRIQLFDDALSVSGSIGWRQNNIGRTEEATTSQLLGSANVDARIGDALGINAGYSNYGMRTPVKNDTFRVETVSQSINLTPTLTIGTDGITHVITASAGMDDYTDYNPITGTEGNNRTRSAMGIYSASLSAIPLNVDISGSWLLNRLGVGDLTITSASLGAGYKLFDGAVRLGATGSIIRTALGADSPDEGVTLRLNGTWRITNALQLRADASTTNVRYGDSRPGTSFRENLLRTSLQWQW